MLKVSYLKPEIFSYEVISNNLIRLFIRENIIEDSGKFTYNEYSLIVNNKDNLEDDIEENFSIYLAQAKENENNNKKLEKIDNLKKSLSNTDYQIIKCVENFMLDSALPYDFSSLLYNRTLWRDEINSIQDNSLTEELTLDQEKERKILEMMACCQSIITNGIDYNNEHYRLNTTDQINLTSLGALAQQGKSVPYHADGKVCRIYTSDEMLGLIQAATQFIIYNTTYFNLLKHTINSMTDVETVKSVAYGMELSEEYKEVLNSIISE